MAINDVNQDWLAKWHTFITEESSDCDCAICLDTYTNPYELSCGHAYCLKCLEDLINKNSGIPTCPTCRSSIEKNSIKQMSVIKVKNILGLGTAFGKQNISMPDYLECTDFDNYELLKKQVQDHAINSIYHNGPWCFQLPKFVTKSMFLRLRHQLEIRGFCIYSLFCDMDHITRSKNSENSEVNTSEFNVFLVSGASKNSESIHCRFGAAPKNENYEDENQTTIEDWDPKFTPDLIKQRGELKLASKLKTINTSSSDEKTKLYDTLMAIFETK
jgi:hypothetical protein